jgi:hypothetical protein
MKSMKDTYRDIFGEDMKKEPYKMVGHSFDFNKRIGKQVCKSCGLVNLRNNFTEWSIRMGCMSSDHPSYESARQKMTKLH